MVIRENQKKEECCLICFVYYEMIKKKINRSLIYECRCDERLDVKRRDLQWVCVIVTLKVYRLHSM